MKASLTNYHQPPRKVRLVANLIRGKSVPAARAALSFLPKKSAPAMGKLLDSAVANARTSGASVDELFIKTITVDKGAVMKRFRPFGRGRSGRLHKTMSIVKLELGTSAAPKTAAKKTAQKRASKTIAKKI
jgi:large subunit ribosomal protein L22